MITIGKTILDNGIPKICVPLVSHTMETLILECHDLHHKPYDVVEWRADYLQKITGLSAALTAIRQELPDAALLFTFRTQAEGGASTVTEDIYFQILQHAIQSGCIDAIDIEYERNRDGVLQTLELAKSNNVTTIMSYHDFGGTPPFAEIAQRLIAMKKLGADVAKLACMPHTPQDVLTLLSATEYVKAQYPDEPLITMSMGKLGVVSRISGETFGSAMTFGSAKEASAPGQIEVTALKQILQALHGAE